MTEAEALKKWCPFSRVYWKEGAPSSNRTPLKKENGSLLMLKGTTCLGSRCMAWNSILGTTNGYCGLKPS